MSALTNDCYCCLAEADWHRVLGWSSAGVMMDPAGVDSERLWNDPPVRVEIAAADRRFIPWQELDVPLPHRGARCWGYALSYPEHRQETLKLATFRFVKQGSVAANSEPIPYRDHLDYELEIGVLLHRGMPDRFGYFLANDLTDRGLQVEQYARRDPAPGFTRAKDFPGSFRAGPLLRVGDASLWRELTATLTLNGQIRQTIRAADCRLDPRQMHRELFAESDAGPWLLALTGTSGGTLFRSPQFRERMMALAAGRLSIKRARRSWLRRLTFLAPGDVLVLESPLLGRSETRVI